MKKMIQPIATITNTSGIEGAIKLRPLSRYFEDYINGKTFFIGISSDQLKSYDLEKIEGDGKSRRFKFEGFKTIAQAKKIVGKTIFIEADLDAEILMISEQVLGYQIICNDGLVVGSLKNVMWLANNDIYVVEGLEKEILIPVIPEVVKNINHFEKKIYIEPMDGLLD
tara:strand:- start:1228 stop:1731 length:504 start_codon:yes stop_codon:yes gene_type:complete